MSRAHDLFARLVEGKMAALDQLIEDREPESLFLDFKQSPRKGSGTYLAAEDNKNLPKAISGFANSSGGVVVLGVDCRRSDATGSEVAEKRPLADAAGFNSKLQAAVSRATVPLHPGVQVFSFAERAGTEEGYVAVLVPQFLGGPVRSVVTNHYHLRSGSDFGIVPHDVLADMFGRAPQANVEVDIVSFPSRIDIREQHFTLQLGLVAVNIGAVVAERPYLTVSFGSFPADLCTVPTDDVRNLSVRPGLRGTRSVVATPNFIVAPGSSEHICDVFVDIPIEQPRAVDLDCTLGVLGAPPKRFKLSAQLSAVTAGIARAKSAGVQSDEIVTLSPNQ